MKRLSKLFSFDELEKLNTAYNYYYFDKDPKFKNSKFKLTTILTPKVLNEYMYDGIESGLNENFYEDDDIESICELIELIEKNIDLVPIIVDKNNNIIDGFHRCSAYEYLGFNSIKVYKEVE